MPNQRALDKERYTIAEFKDKLDLLRLIAEARRISLADVFREMSDEYLDRHADEIDHMVKTMETREKLYDRIKRARHKS